jgi:hypothetical protein
MRSHNLIALMLSFVVAVSVVQTAGLSPTSVSADNILTLPLTRASNSTESIFASGEVDINLDSGHLTIQLKQATPNAVYQAIFVAATNSIPLGTFTVGNGAQGHLETTLSPGAYVGMFQVLGRVFVQFVSPDASFVLRTTTGATGTSSASTTSPPKTNPSAIAFRVHVDPSSRTIKAGDYARFNIQILANDTASVLLTAKNIPSRSTAIFTQDFGQANPEFDSSFTIVTSADISAGTYAMTIVSIVNGNETDSQLGLVVTSSSANTRTNTFTVPGTSLAVSINADQHHYEPNDTVVLQGKVSDITGSAVADAVASIQVDGPTGAETESNIIRTDAAGTFRISFQVPADAAGGTYTAYASVAKSGYTSATTHTTFVIKISSTPSVVIREIYTSDITGNQSAVFRAGQTVLVWVVVDNGGATLTDAVVWVQIRDSNLTPIWIGIQVSTLGTGQTARIAFGFVITPSVSPGLYAANALVSDKLISRGGTFVASTNTEFAVTS